MSEYKYCIEGTQEFFETPDDLLDAYLGDTPPEAWTATVSMDVYHQGVKLLSSVLADVVSHILEAREVDSVEYIVTEDEHAAWERITQ